MLNNYPHLDEALKKLSVYQLEAYEHYDLPKRVIYKALRKQQARISQQKTYLLAAQTFATQLANHRAQVS